MDLSRDCEVITLAPRGHAAAIIVGQRWLSADQLASLLQQYVAQAAPGSLLPLPAYWSPDGWQVTTAINVTAELAAPPAVPAEPPAPTVQAPAPDAPRAIGHVPPYPMLPPAPPPRAGQES